MSESDSRKAGENVLRDSSNEASRVAKRAHLSFMLLLAFVATAVSTTTDESLLREAPVHLPLLGVQVATSRFYAITPWLLVIVHWALLLDLVLLSAKFKLLVTLADSRVWPETMDSFFFTQAWFADDSTTLASKLARWFSVLSLVALPPLLLLWMQLAFAPFRNGTVTCWQALAVTCDLVLLWLLRPQFRGVVSASVRGQSRTRVVSRMIIVILLSCGVLATAWILALTSPAVGFAATVREWLPGTVRIWIPTGLRLSGLTLVASEAAPEVVSALVSSGSVSVDDARSAAAQGLNLQKRDLRYADFSRSKLPNADLRGADLEGAAFIDAELDGARLTTTVALGGSTVVSGAHMRAADLTLVDLMDQDLSSVEADFAKLHDTKLAGARMGGAKMAGAWARLIDLRGADLRGADLQGVDLFNADCRGADFRRARMQGSDLNSARLQGADLRGAMLQGANLEGANLDGADLRGASLLGVRFDGRSTCNLADLREVDLGTPWDGDPNLLIERYRETLREFGHTRSQLEFEPRIRAILTARPVGACAGSALVSPEPEARVLTASSLPCTDSYADELGALLVKHACLDNYVARGLLLERRNPGQRPSSVPREGHLPWSSKPRWIGLATKLQSQSCPSWSDLSDFEKEMLLKTAARSGDQIDR